MTDDLTTDDFDKYVTPAKPKRQREFRTDRNNNPIAAAVTTGGRNQFTDALDQAEIPWEHGDPFPGNPKLSTIRIKGDPYEGARAILSNSNALKWYRGTTGKSVLPKYGVRSSADFTKLPIDHQNDIINGIYQSEGGSGKIKPTQDDFDKYVSRETSQAMPTPGDDFEKYVTAPTATEGVKAGIQGIRQPREKVSVEAKPLEFQGETPQAPITDLQAQPKAPIQFQPDTSEPTTFAARAAQRATGAVKQGKPLPSTHPDLTAKKVVATFDKMPESNEAIDALMAQVGPDALTANQKYRAETGHNLALSSQDISSLTSQNPQGKYEVSAAPTQRLIRIVNAYNRGGIVEAQSESKKMDDETYADLQERAKIAGDKAISSLKEGYAAGATGDAQFLYNISMLSRALYTSGRYGTDSPEYKALEKEDKENQAVLNEATKTVGSPKTTTGEIVAAALELPQITAVGGNLPVSQYVRHLNEGQVQAGTKAMLAIPMQAVFHGIGGATRNLPWWQQEAAARAATAGVGAALAPEGQRIRGATVGALIPVPMSHGAITGEYGAPLDIASRESQTLGVDRAQTVPDIEGTLATREAAVRPPTEPIDEKHYSNYQPRRARNTESGNKGQFKTGSPQIPSPEQPAERSNQPLQTSTEVPREPSATVTPQTLQSQGAQPVKTETTPSVPELSVNTETQDKINAELARRHQEEAVPIAVKEAQQNPLNEAPPKSPRPALAKSWDVLTLDRNAAAMLEPAFKEKGWWFGGNLSDPDGDVMAGKGNRVEKEPFTQGRAGEAAKRLYERLGLAEAESVKELEKFGGQNIESAAKAGKFYVRRLPNGSIDFSKSGQLFAGAKGSGLYYVGGDTGITATHTLPRGIKIEAATEREFNAAKAAQESEAKVAKPISEATGVPSSPESQVASARSAQGKQPIRTLSEGAESKATTERGTEVNTKYAIVDAKDLITSHDDLLNRNPDFPEELQPRDRGRAASEVQIQKIEKNPRGELLAESPKASDGAPIVGKDGIVESGNARTIGLRRAYEKGNAESYRQYLLDNAEKLGLDPKSIQDAKEPVLVRLRTSDVNREQFAREANESSLAAMSAPEQAKSDSKQLTSDLLGTFRPSESGELNTTANTPFIRAFMRDVVGPNDLGRYISAEGEVSQEGLARIRNAIFAKAYGDSPEGLRALEKIAESPDNNVRNITNALLQRAGQFASLKDAIAKGDRFPLDLTSDLTKALGKLSSLREEDTSVADYLNQRQLFEEDLSPLQKQALKMFDEYKRSTKAISSVLDNYAKAIEAIGDPKQQTMFGGEAPSKDSVFDAAVKETIDDAKRQSDLFSSERVQPEPAARSNDQAVTETAQAQTPSEANAPQEPEFVRRARERTQQRLTEKRQGVEYRHAGLDPHELVDSLIVRGWELYDQKVKPTFEEWSRKLREEFGPKAEEHLRNVWAQVSGGEQTGKPQPEIPGMESPPSETTGIAHRVETAARGAEPARGQAIGAQESVERGRQLLREGSNLKAAIDGFEKSGAISADAMALVRARHEELAQAANRAFDAGRQKLDSPEFQAAEKTRQDFYDNAVKPMQTAWSNTGRAQQGETNIDTGTFYGMYRAFKDLKGREPSPREAVEMRLHAERNANVDSAVKNLSSQLAAELDRAVGIKDLPSEVQKSLSRFIDQAKRESRRTGRQQARKSLDDEAVVIKQNIAAAFQKIKNQSGVQPSGLARIDPEGEITKQVIALAKNRVKAGVTDAAQLVDDVHGAIKDFADVTKREVTEAILGQGAPKGKQVESKWAKTKKSIAASLKAKDAETTQRELGKRLQRGPISPEDASAVWKYARENYVDKGNNNFADIRAKVASDLGISPETVTRSLANTKAAKQISNEMWAKMSDRRRLRSNAESWIKQADAPLAVRAFENARRLWFIKATMGHGAVAPFTHAPANAFIPARWADFWRNFGRTYQFMVNKGGHERAMSDLETSPNYITAQRAGLANDPKRGYDEYQSPWMAKTLGKLGVSGNRAFDSLKTMRQDLFDSAWNKMTNDIKSPETAKALAQEINASTGSSKALSGQDWPSRFVSKAMFAAPLEASRWDFLVRDNYRAIKAFSNWKGATPGERYMAKRVASRNAQLVATYGALLAANQGLLTASGSDDKINVTDPTKSDFLAFKVGGHVVSPAGGLLTAVRFVGNLVNIGMENKKPREKISDASTTTFKYGRSKLSPLFGTGADVWLQSDYSGRPLPFSAQEGTAKLPRYSWPEYVWSTQTPIPLAEAARTYYAEREKGASKPGALAKSVPIGVVAATGIRVREDFPSSPASDMFGSDRPKSRKEIERLGMKLRGVQKQPDESQKEFEGRQSRVNPYIRKTLEAVVSSPDYDKESDENKIEWLKQAAASGKQEGEDAEPEKPEKPEKREFPIPLVPRGLRATPTPKPRWIQ